MDIHTLEPGEKITENGFYNIPLHIHHNQPCDGISVTSGVLRDVHLKSPADAWAWSKLNPKGRRKEATPAMEQGAAMAALIAGGVDEIKKQFYVLKKGIPRKPSAAQWLAFEEKRAAAATIRACKAWLPIMKDPRPALTHEEAMQLIEMAKVLRKDPAAQMAMEGLPEITMAVWDEESRIWLLSRPDTVNLTALATSDYKKMASTHQHFPTWLVDSNIRKGGYDMQMGMASDVMLRLTDNMPTAVGIVAQWDQYPYHVIARGIDDDDLMIGIYHCRKAVRTIRECLDSGHWPGPGEEVGNFRRGDDQKNRILEQMAKEGFEL